MGASSTQTPEIMGCSNSAYGFNPNQLNATMTLMGCVFKNMSAYGLSGWFRVGNTGNVVNVFNNVFYLNTATIPRMLSAFTGTSILNFKNNIIVNTLGTQTFEYSGFALPAGNTINFNNNCINGTWTAITAGTGNITTDPLFVDATGDDFHLQITSPCRNTGVII